VTCFRIRLDRIVWVKAWIFKPVLGETAASADEPRDVAAAMVYERAVELGRGASIRLPD
jgi:hypothetical protein